jgi:hypothetical protein
MSHQVKAENGGYIVQSNGQSVLGARVNRISFPSTTSHTIHGDVHHISGPCVASITLVNGDVVENVPVVFDAVV